MLRAINCVVLVTLFLSNVLAQQDNLQDPTRPLIGVVSKSQTAVSTATETAKLNQLQAIFINELEKKAIIDNQIVKVGQAINGYQVHQIKKQSVVLRKGKSYKTLTMIPDVKAMNKNGVNKNNG